MTTAEQIAHALGNDGQQFSTQFGSTLDALCESCGGSESWARTEAEDSEESWWEKRRVIREVYSRDAWDLHRYAFPDGSAIVIAGDCWDLEGAEPFSWAGA